MPKSLMVGIDGSAEGQSALGFALELAVRGSSTLWMVGIVDEPAICSGHAMPIGGSHYQLQMNETKLKDAERRVQEFAADYQRQARVRGIEPRVVFQTGSPAQVLVQESQCVDLLVLPSQPHFRFMTQEEPDDTAMAVLRDSPRPVLLVPAKASTDIRNVLVAYDGSLQAAQALEAAVTSGLLRNRTVHLLYVAEQEAARIVLNRAECYLIAHGISVQRHGIAATTNIADLIREMAAMLDCDLLVMGVYGRSSILEFFIGSVTKNILATSSIPLLLDH